MLGLMFTAPIVLAGLVSLPVIWWLLRATPPPPREVAFGGTVFLQSLANAKETPARTPWWLLLLRLGVAALIILGLAGPVINADDADIGSGPLLFVVDDSWPAAAQWRDRIDAAESVALYPGSDRRIARVLTTAGTPTLSDTMPLTQAVDLIAGLSPKAALTDHVAVSTLTDELNWSDYHVYWLSDGTIGRRNEDRKFILTLNDARSTAIFQTTRSGRIAIANVSPDAAGLEVLVKRIGTTTKSGSIIAISGDGRTLTEVAFTFDPGAETTLVAVDLPLELRNDVARISIAGERQAGATWLVDAGNRRIRAGLITQAATSLLDSGFYIESALRPLAAVNTGTPQELAVPEVGLIVLDDIGTLRPLDQVSLVDWVARGGVLLRFAGPNTAGSADARAANGAQTYPLPLRGTERSFGGALTWTDPLPIAPFMEDSPLADITLSDDIFVRRQVLTQTSLNNDDTVWARLADGTPLITARKFERGYFILVHVTATPTWSDLPISDAFPLLMSRIARLAAGVPPPIPDQTLPPFQLLDGFGVLNDPSADAANATPDNIAKSTAAPGLYGSANSAIAVNTYPEGSRTIDPLNPSLLPPGTRFRGPDGQKVHAVGPALLALALIFFMLDNFVLAANKWRRNGLVSAVVLAFAISPTLLDHANAQEIDLRPELSPEAIQASLDVRFAYVVTGDGPADRLSRAGLYGISREATRRSALEPGEPLGVDIERDDLSVYPLIYWGIRPDAPIPSDGALSRLERFMASGGLLIIDTQDGDLQAVGSDTPAKIALRRILRRMNVPPLQPVPSGHILTRSFYLIDELPGRNSLGTVWVEANAALRETTDNVPTLIIGARDWAAAWAMDERGVPLRAPGPDGERGREMAIRTGINMAMVALTGNYKGDQVHVQELLDRLGDEGPTP